MMLRIDLLLAVFLGLASSLLLVGCAAHGQEDPTPTPIPQVVTSEKIVFRVERGPIRSVRDFYGEVVTARQDDLFFRATGFIMRVSVKDGDPVLKGDLLAELQIDDLQAQLEQARIDLQASKEDHETGKLQQAYDLQKAESELAILEIQVDQARKRLEKLWGAQKENAQAELAIAEERLKTAQVYLELIKNRKDSGELAVIERNQLAVERLERLLAERQIYAPYDGIVLHSYLKPGNDIEAFSTAFIVGDPDTLLIRIPYSDELYEILDPSTAAFMSLTKSKDRLYPVKFQPDFMPVTNYKGGLDTSGEMPALTYFYFSVPQDLANDRLPVGGGVFLTVELGKKEDALLLPPTAFRGNTTFKYVIVLENDTHRRVEVVSIGLKDEKLWEVIADLKEGDQVLGP